MKDDESDIGVETIVAALERVAAGFQARIARWGEAGADWERLSAAVQAAYGGVAALLLVMTLVGGVTALTYYGAARIMRRWINASGALVSFAIVAISIAAALVAGMLVARLLAQGHPQVHLTLSAAAVAAALGSIVWTMHSSLIRSVRNAQAAGQSPAVSRMILLLNLALAWGLVGAAIMQAFSVWQVGWGLRDLIGTLGFGGPIVIGISAIVLAHRRKVAALIGGPRPRTASRGVIARHWPAVLSAAMLLIYVSGQLALTLGSPLPSLTLISASVAILSLPYLDGVLRRWSRKAANIDELPAMRVALRRTARPAAIAALLAILVSVWLSPLIALSSGGSGRLAWLALEIALIGLVTALGWNLVSVLAGRAVGDGLQMHGDEESDTPRTRFETLAPLLAATAKTIIASLGALSVLVALGISVWPIVTGLSVFGIAIGFGSQTLVKDVVSGVFFLADDAFRMGEYIETTGAKGTVEKISIRSVSLRHHRGPLATVPYGSIGRVLNFSRDYAIEKIAFRVAMDTDVEKLRKIFKKIGLELAEDPELKDDLLQPFKSQGIAEVEDGTLIVRGKFMAKAGRQHNIRKKVMLAVHKAFLENGIQAVARPLTAIPARQA